MKRKKIVILCFTLILILLVACYSLLQISKSRTFQFFGELVPRVETNEKVVALTFDDGPTEYTDAVLQTLAEKKVTATFFAIGSLLEKYPDSGKAIVEQGHQIGNHSYSHERFLLKSQSFIDEEIQKTNKAINDTGFRGEILFRPPNGKKLFGLPWYLSKKNMTTIMWDVEPDTYGTNTDFLVLYTLKNTKPGSIILLHPFCASCTGQREAIGKIINGLRGEGYQFVTVSELLSYDQK